MPRNIDWLTVIRLVSNGKLDRRDCAIIDALANGSARGNKTIAAKTGIPVSTVQGRRAKIRAVLATA